MRRFIFTLCLTFILGLSTIANAALVDNGGGLIYDTDSNITWYVDPTGTIRSWTDSLAWAAGLTVGGVTGWRLPTALNPDLSGPDAGLFVTESEMGHLYYTELGNSPGGITNEGPFTNLHHFVYWAGEEYVPVPTVAWAFFFHTGEQDVVSKISSFYTMAVHSGNVTLAPANQSPVAAPAGGGTYEINSSVVLGGTVSDVDGDSLSYKWMEGITTLPGSEGTIVTPIGGAPVGLPPYTIETLPLGVHTLTLQVQDSMNPPVSQDITVTIIDDMAPTLAPAPDKTILWPANHKMVPITIFANASDNSGGPVTLSASVASNELQDGLGDGDTPQDWTTPVINNGIITLQLRAERSGKGTVRIYTVTIVATDQSGNSSTAAVNITVPHDRGK